MTLRTSTVEELNKIVEINYGVLSTDEQTGRLPLEECRELIGEDAIFMTDEQIKAFRDALYTVVESTLDNLDKLSDVVC